MRAFEIKKGTRAIVLKKGMGLEAAGRYKGILTKKDNLFFLEDVVIDPIGKVDRVLKEMRQEIAEEIASKGYYGFENGKWILIVHSNDIRVI